MPLLREDDASPPERLLQSVWQHQRLRRDRLRTVDGQPVSILHPGFRNAEGGPDFRGAMVRIGDGPCLSGDIEVDLRPSGWHAHGHDRNPAFAGVILHVIWEGEAPAAGGPPAACLKPVLDAPIGELSLWLAGEAAQEFPVELEGKCCAPLSRLSEAQVFDLLRQAAQVRLQSKASLFHARAREAGWDQALWEGLFRALGYKHNVWPMQRLAELRPRWCAADLEPLTLQARLFGISGLLPVELTRTRSGSDGYLRQVWDRWWREQDEFSDCLLPRNLWRLHGLRPANHPQRRLALGALWAGSGRVAGELEKWCARETPGRVMVQSLLDLLQVPSDEFWSWHWTFRSARMPRPQPLLGDARVTDLAVNVILPWLWARAAGARSDSLRAIVEDRYFAWPAAEDNSVLKLARNRLLGAGWKRRLPGAAEQQGLMQMVRDFCDHSNSICEACKLPKLVEDFAKKGGAGRQP